LNDTAGNSSNTFAEEDGLEKDVMMTTNSPSLTSTATTLQDDLDTTSDNESEENEDNKESSTHSDYEVEVDNECPSYDNYEGGNYGGVEMSPYNKQIIIDDCTKMDIFAPVLYWLDI